MPFWVNRNGTWVQVSEAGGTPHRIYAYRNSQWRRANEVWSRVNSLWKQVYVRTPNAVSSASLTVNGSSSTELTVTASPLDVFVSWITPSDETGLPYRVRYFVNGVQDGGDYNLSAGTNNHSTNIAIAAGQSKNISATVAIRNSTVTGAQAGSNAIVVSWAPPSVGPLYVTPDYSADQLTVVWYPQHVPAGAGYIVELNLDYAGWVTLVAAPGQSGTVAYISLGPSYDIVDYNSGVTVSVEISIKMYANGGVVATTTTQFAYYVATSV